MARQPTRHVSFDAREAGARSSSQTHGITPGLTSWGERRRQAQRQHLSRQFAKDCEAFFAPHVLEEGDRAFLAGASELELMGLASFLCNHPRTIQIRWNVLFHFNLFHGRPIEYSRQFPTARRVQQCFASALRRIPYHDVRFFTTTDELTDQYNRLNVARFQTLTYPINERFSQPTEENSGADSNRRPLQMTLAGAIRREKRQCQVSQFVVDELWDDLFATNQLALRVQRPNRGQFLRPKIKIRVPRQRADLSKPVVYSDHPLGESEYFDLIRSTDIGLLAYDSESYFARRAGILGEYLSVGRPVVVLGGNWLSEQLQEPMQRHVDTIRREYPARFRLTPKDLQLDSPNELLLNRPISCGGGRPPISTSFSLPSAVDALLVEFRCRTANPSGQFCRVETQQFEGDRTISRPQAIVIGTRPQSQSVAALFRIDRAANRCRIQFANESDAEIIDLIDVGISGLDTNGKIIPLSAVGVIAADVEHLPDAVREVVAHHEHYRATSERFAQQYRLRHRPETTFAELVDESVARVKSA